MEKKQSDIGEYTSGAHSVWIEGRKQIRITGVIDIESFQEDETTVLTQAGALTIWGENMKLGKLDPDNGQVILEGDFISLEYEQPTQERKFGFFRRK